MKTHHSCLFVSFVALVATSLGGAQDAPRVLPIWPEGVPDLRADAAPDQEANERVSAVHTPTLTVYPAPADRANGTAVVVCPGGGYVRLSIVKEGSEIAAWLNSQGITAFVLRYRMVEYGHPAPLRDVLRSIRLVRSQAESFGVKPDRIGVIGFSAGGHLASSAATLFDAPEGRTGAPLDAVSGRPDFAMLIYPVISMRDPLAHAGSRKALLGENPSEEMVAHLSTDEQVTAQTPPVFLMSTYEDKTVPVGNALAFFAAMKKAGVPAEIHVYEQGPHGVGMRPGHVAATAWPKAAEAWMRLHGWIPVE